MHAALLHHRPAQTRTDALSAAQRLAAAACAATVWCGAACAQSVIAVESLQWEIPPGWTITGISRDGTAVGLEHVTCCPPCGGDSSAFIESKLWRRDLPSIQLPPIAVSAAPCPPPCFQYPYCAWNTHSYGVLSGNGTAMIGSAGAYCTIAYGCASGGHEVSGIWRLDQGLTVAFDDSGVSDPGGNYWLFDAHWIYRLSEDGTSYHYSVRFAGWPTIWKQFVHRPSTGESELDFSPSAISADGHAVAGAYALTGEAAPRLWIAPGPSVALPIPAGGGPITNASTSAFSADGSILLGGVGTPGQWRSIRWIDGQAAPLPEPPAGFGSTFLSVLSPDGQLAAGSVFSGGSYTDITLWSPGGGWRKLTDLLTDAGLADSASKIGELSSIAAGPAPGTYALVCRNGYKFVLGQSCSGTTESVWSNAAGGTYSDPANWQGNLPALGDNLYARFITPDVYAVNVDPASLYVEAYSVSAGDVTFNLQGSNSQLNAGSTVCNGYSLEVGRAPNEQATVRVSNGTMNTAQSVWLGNNTGTNASLYVEPGATLQAGANNSGHSLQVGRSAQSSGSVNLGAAAIVKTDELHVARGEGSSGSLTANPGSKVTAGSTTFGGAPAATATVELLGDPNLPASQQTDIALGVLQLGTGSVPGGAGAMVNVKDGAILRTLVVEIAKRAQSDCSLNITGPDSLWDHYGSGDIIVGQFGTGHVTIDRGPVIGGTAVLNMTDFASSLIVGENAGSSGAFTVRGDGASVHAPGHVAVIGNSPLSSGTMLIDDGADVTLGALTIGAFGTGTFTLTGEGSTLTCDLPGDLGGLTGFFFNFGTATVNDGATLHTKLGAVGEPTISNVNMIVDGVNTTWTNDAHLYVGWGRPGPQLGGHGTLTVRNGASVQTGVLCVGDNGTVSGPYLEVGTGSPLLATPGIHAGGLVISPGMTLDVPQTVFFPNAQFGGSGTWPAAYSNQGTVTAGIIAPTAQSSALTMQQGFSQAATGSLSVAVGAWSDDPYGEGCEGVESRTQKLQVNGTASIDGTLRVRYFHPADSCNELPPSSLLDLGPIEVLAATVLRGSFESVEADESLSPYGVEVSYDYAAGKVFVTVLPPPPPCPADLNGDGSVGAEDLATLLGQWGGADSADLDGDGSVGPADLAILLGAWGTCP